MPKVIIGVADHFDACHHLPTYEGKCKQVHGHTWHVVVEAEAEVDPTTGMSLDLTILKKTLHEALDVYDHQDLNKFFPNPTCESLAITLCHFMHQRNLPVVNVMVQEGEGGYAIYTLPPIEQVGEQEKEER